MVKSIPSLYGNLGIYHETSVKDVTSNCFIHCLNAGGSQTLDTSFTSSGIGNSLDLNLQRIIPNVSLAAEEMDKSFSFHTPSKMDLGNHERKSLNTDKGCGNLLLFMISNQWVDLVLLPAPASCVVGTLVKHDVEYVNDANKFSERIMK